jgi:hypothetical protein
MHRTTILLPDDLYKSAGKEARSMGVSLGELIRRRLASSSQRTEPKRPFFSRQPWTQETPKDLSLNHDKYLYET